MNNSLLFSHQIAETTKVHYLGKTFHYIPIIKHVLLMLFTFGIYMFAWIYATTSALNAFRDEPDRSSLTQLLLCLFVPFYLIYWTYSSAQRIDRINNERNVTDNFSTVALILSIFVPFIAIIAMQDKINKIIDLK